MAWRARSPPASGYAQHWHAQPHPAAAMPRKLLIFQPPVPVGGWRSDHSRSSPRPYRAAPCPRRGSAHPPARRAANPSHYRYRRWSTAPDRPPASPAPHHKAAIGRHVGELSRPPAGSSLQHPPRPNPAQRPAPPPDRQHRHAPHATAPPSAPGTHPPPVRCGPSHCRQERKPCPSP
jgi:hypothetical protein